MSSPVANAPVSSSFVAERFELNVITQALLKKRPEPWPKAYGAFSAFIFYRTYSRDGERWWQVIRRVIEGTFSIRKSHMLNAGLSWDEEGMQRRAHEMAVSAFDGEWGPPGRGYWAMGTDLVYEKGSMALNNCGYTEIKDLGADLHWAMDALMMGVGVGFSTWHDVITGLRGPRRTQASERKMLNDAFTIRHARVEVEADDATPGDPFSQSYHEAKAIWDTVDAIEYVIPDSREGWCDSVKLLVDSYYGGPEVHFDYSRIRPKGAKIKGFGGEASGPWPLRKLHRQIRVILTHAATHKAEWTNERLTCDLVNLIGCCIVAGNVRRSATIALGHPESKEFAELKNYETFPYRRRHGWMSNNSYVLSERDHFTSTLPLIADGIKRNGEPGFYNLKAVRAFGRLGDRVGTELPNGSFLQEDYATGINPCGEVPLENKELCCLAEWYPTNCLDATGRIDRAKALRAVEHAAFYTQSVQLLMTHRPETNDVIRRNRRTGVSLAGAAALRELVSMSDAISLMEDGYAAIRRENKRGSLESCVPEAIRVTAEKPSGTTSLMLGVPAGAHWPTSGYIKRAARVDAGRQALRDVLDRAQVPHEPDLFSANTEVYYFPVKTPGADTIRPVDQVSMWEQADFAATLAQHFVDNAVSVTVTFDPLTRDEKAAESRRLLALYAVTDDVEKRKAITEQFKAIQKRTPEGDDVERLIASYAGRLKSMSMLPRSGHGYAQAPETPISRNDYMARVVSLNDFDWGSFHDDGNDETYCGSCQSV